MKTPESLVTAVDSGIIQEVVRPLMSGKEARVYVVVAAGIECVAKVYKEATQRTFKHRAEYAEGRRTRNSRDQRAISKRSRHGRAQDEAGWRGTEVDMIFRLRDAGVRVPELLNFVDGVLVMEFVKDAEGNPAPRLGDLSFDASEARDLYRQLLREVTRMLCAGVIHGDLSEFNVLLGADGPVVIDFPQSMEAARNQSARKFLLRDVKNLHRFVERYAPNQRTLPYGEEIWSLYEANRLAPETELRGDYRAPDAATDTGEVLALIEDADRDETKRREARGEEPPVEAAKPLRTVVDFTKDAGPRRGAGPRSDAGARRGAGPRSVQADSRRSPSPHANRALEEQASAKPAVEQGERAPRSRRSRRGRKEHTAAADTRGVEASARGSNQSTTPTEKRIVGPGEAASPKRRRRGARTRKRSASLEAKADAPRNGERSAKPAADQRSGNHKPASAGAANRPARRRRRRPRSAASREPT